jgi:hypothetical protein
MKSNGVKMKDTYILIPESLGKKSRITNKHNFGVDYFNDLIYWLVQELIATLMRRALTRTSLLRIQAMETKRTSMGVQLIKVMAEAQSNSSKSPSRIQEQSQVKWMPRMHAVSVFDD